MTLLMVALGAAVGAPLRWLIDRFLRARLGDGFPYGTLTVNIAGSFLLGLLIGYPAPTGAAALLGTGFCGALTTYSTFTWEVVTLPRPRAAGYLLLSLTVGPAAALGGLTVTG